LGGNGFRTFTMKISYDFVYINHLTKVAQIKLFLHISLQFLFWTAFFGFNFSSALAGITVINLMENVN
jgi:hypothetical protein